MYAVDESRGADTDLAESDLPFLIGLPLASIWKEIGVQLGVPVDQLDAIQQNNHGSVDMSKNCLIDMFTYWLLNGEETTAEKLIMAVCAVGRYDVERTISQKYGKWKVIIINRRILLLMYPIIRSSSCTCS